MSKSLKTIQTLASLGKIFSQIIYVCCIVGGISCLVGITTLCGVNGLVIGGKDIASLIVSEGEIAIETLVFYCIAGCIACVTECIVAKFANIYFKHELNAGTPFTAEGSKEILRLGILTIAIPTGALLLEGVAFGIYEIIYPNAVQINMENMTSIGIGIMLILASVIFKYGAELIEKN